MKRVMNHLGYPANKRVPYILICSTYTLYVAMFVLYHHQIGSGIAALATIPVIGASWYFGVTGGLLTAFSCILANTMILITDDPAHLQLLNTPGNWIGSGTLILTGLVIGSLGTTARERRDAILKLQQYERDQKAHTQFLESLNQVTAMALEADTLDGTLKILGERIGGLFEADDSFFSLWDEAKHVPIPIAAYGSLSDIYPYVQFEPGEQTLTTSVMEAGQPIAVPDIENSPFLSPKVAAIFPSRSMLGLPLIAQRRQLGALLFGYKKFHSFREHELLHAHLAAEQVSLVLSKALFLEEQRKQVRQLTALHGISLIAVEADNEDQLVNGVTEIIGRNLFPDNFGILLLDEHAGVLYAHPSYRFFSDDERHTMDISTDQGISGLVARTGKSIRTGNVRQWREYLDMDDRTISELCVPIKFKERILGVINAESTKKNAFSEEDERLLITLAGQIATALEQIRRARDERRWLDQLAHSKELTYALAQITTHIEKAFSMDDIIQNLGAELSKLDLTCIMCVYDRTRDLFTVKYTSMRPQSIAIVENNLGYPLVGYRVPRTKLSPGNLFYPAVLSNPEEEIRLLFAHLTTQDILRLLPEVGIDSGTEPLRLPLTFEDNLLGILWIWGRGLTKADLPIMSIFAKQIGVSLERARLFQEVQSLALTDPLTGLQNRRSLFELGRVEFARAKRMKRPFCCMMLDLDHFKQINDQYGHLIGDQVLQEFARRCLTSVREVDLVGRYGGEELIILLPETDGKTSMQVAERLRASISATPINVFDRQISVTVSIGVATQDENTTDLETLIARADQAMYIAKHRGRNCVAISK